ncbi:LysR family substrate-binding domain-containing protein [Cupriavidus basilensis]|uniref:LysR family substrate-binding domain-containing protein n=1 Tax=Cupriavidus basilensis TaxID=68895 RepID=UPI0023E7CE7E|nr:LysR family substrate-binding domain-containing protein [Cupriavidus basilensis]MDF3887633.1 LysR family substrate-binding domain-containing protein [Cupriavidus basilensis]
MPSHHPKADRPVIHLQDAADETFLMFRRDVNPVNHDAILGLFNRADIYPWLVHSIRNWLTMVAMVSEGHGMAIVCESLARLSCAGVRVLPLVGEQADAPASLVWHQARRRLPCVSSSPVPRM